MIVDDYVIYVKKYFNFYASRTLKNNLGDVMKLSECKSTSQIQHEFDIIQGKFGREGFSQRYSPVYLYLCSLVANYSDEELSNEDRELVKQYNAVETYLLYDTASLMVRWSSGSHLHVIYGEDEVRRIYG